MATLEEFKVLVAISRLQSRTNQKITTLRELSEGTGLHHNTIKAILTGLADQKYLTVDSDKKSKQLDITLHHKGAF